MKLIEKVKKAIIENLEKENPKPYYDLWCLKNDHAIFSESFTEWLSTFLEKELSKGYTEDDLTIYVSNSVSHIYCAVTNRISGLSFSRSQFISIPNRSQFTKQQLTEADAPILEAIAQNRKIIGNIEAAKSFLDSGKFLQNNLKAMYFDQETHDFVLSVKTQIEKDKEDAIEAGRNELRQWAEKEGSELLKLRIKHGQNWLNIAQEEYAIAHTVGFGFWEYDAVDDDWDVKNATLEQLQELEKAQAENPNCEIKITRSKFIQEDPHGDYEPEITHRTFLECAVKTPVSTYILYKEIKDISNE